MMNEKMIENNMVKLSGEVVGNPVFNHEIFGEGFYTLELRVKRLSDAFDVVPLIISDRLIDVKKDYEGMFVTVVGQFRSYNQKSETRNRLVLTTFVRDIEFCEEEEFEHENTIELEGYVCKAPIYRKTPLGREIADVLIAVNRPYGKSDYIPCICWGRNASFAGKFQIGDSIKVIGRIQSRAYQKKISETEVEEKIAYEISVSKLEVGELASAAQ